jgi:hypothetical protein
MASSSTSTSATTSSSNGAAEAQRTARKESGTVQKVLRFGLVGDGTVGARIETERQRDRERMRKRRKNRFFFFPSSSFFDLSCSRQNDDFVDVHDASVHQRLRANWCAALSAARVCGLL